MEPLITPIKLLTKLSHASCILVYFTTYGEARQILCSLWTATRDFWGKHKNELMTLFENHRLSLSYKNEFDSEIAEYLTAQDRYFDYTLDVHFHRVEALNWLLKFIQKIKYPQMLKFSDIK